MIPERGDAPIRSDFEERYRAEAGLADLRWRVPARAVLGPLSARSPSPNAAQDEEQRQSGYPSGH